MFYVSGPISFHLKIIETELPSTLRFRRNKVRGKNPYLRYGQAELGEGGYLNLDICGACACGSVQ